MSKKPPPDAPPDGPFHNPFGQLEGLRGALPSKPAPTASKVPAGPARAVVRLERKGRGGKEVTVVEQLGLPAKELERWLRELKNALGCGGTVDDATLVFQGDHRDRLKTVLEQRGVKRISVG